MKHVCAGYYEDTRLIYYIPVLTSAVVVSGIPGDQYVKPPTVGIQRGGLVTKFESLYLPAQYVRDQFNMRHTEDGLALQATLPISLSTPSGPRGANFPTC